MAYAATRRGTPRADVGPRYHPTRVLCENRLCYQMAELLRAVARAQIPEQGVSLRDGHAKADAVSGTDLASVVVALRYSPC
eukprot:1826550-Rhodomonas_salina.4